MGLEHGLFGWADVASPDTAAAEAFYTGLFGWDAVTMPSESMPYTMFSKDGKLVAGMGPLTEDAMAAGQPPVWSSYIIVDDVDAIHARALELGATPLMEPTQIMDSGRMAFMFDPSGAAIGFWEPGTHGGAEVFNLPGTMGWNDLASRDAAAATSFYTQLLGWNTDDMDMGDGSTYTIMKVGERSNGGIYDASAFLPDGVPSHWTTWFVVDDTDAAVARATELGGTVVRPAQDSPQGRMGFLQDPTGAMFAIIASTSTDGQPPR